MKPKKNKRSQKYAEITGEYLLHENNSDLPV